MGQSLGGKIANCSWEEIHRIMERAVERGLERRKAEKVTEIGIDCGGLDLAPATH